MPDTEQDRETAAILDMWYGSRDKWRDLSLPLGMDMSYANPAYVDHCEATYDEEADWYEELNRGYAQDRMVR